MATKKSSLLVKGLSDKHKDFLHRYAQNKCGKDGTGGTIQDFKNLNQNIKIHIEHGSTGTKP